MNSVLVDSDGENRAIRTFLQLYGGTNSPTVKQMKEHLSESGFDGCWPDWVDQSDVGTGGHLTKGGAQDWIRYLFSLEAHQAQTAPVVPEWLKPIAWGDVVKAIRAVDTEARRRGSMFPQTSDEQAEDRAATRRVADMIEWYATKGGALAETLQDWPRYSAAAPSAPTSASNSEDAKDAQRYRRYREILKWQINPNRVASEQEVDAHVDAYLAATAQQKGGE